jgi:hypothetical protein
VVSAHDIAVRVPHWVVDGLKQVWFDSLQVCRSQAPVPVQRLPDANWWVQVPEPLQVSVPLHHRPSSHEAVLPGYVHVPVELPAQLPPHFGSVPQEAEQQ